MATSISNKKDTELLKELKEKREELREFRFGMSGSKKRDVKAGRQAKKHIARVMTEMTARKQK